MLCLVVLDTWKMSKIILGMRFWQAIRELKIASAERIPVAITVCGIILINVSTTSCNEVMRSAS